MADRYADLRADLDQEITKESWLRRYMQRFIERSGMDKTNARICAEAGWEQRKSDDDSPEDAVDEEILHWEGN